MLAFVAKSAKSIVLSSTRPIRAPLEVVLALLDTACRIS